MPRLQTALTSEDQTPDLVEIGNTQTPDLHLRRRLRRHHATCTTSSAATTCCPGFVEAGTADDTFYAAPYYSGARAVFYRKDFVRGRRRGGADDARGVRRGRHHPAGGQPRRGHQLLRLLVPRAGLVQRRRLDLRATAATSPPQDGDDVDRVRCPRPSRIEALARGPGPLHRRRPARRGTPTPTSPGCRSTTVQSAMFSAPTWARWSIDLPQCNQGVDPEDDLRGGDGAARRAAGLQRGAHRRLPAPGHGRSGSRATVFAGGSNIADPGQVAAPGPGAEPAADHLQRGVPDDARPRTGLIPGEHASTPTPSVTTSTPRPPWRRRSTPSSPRRPRSGPTSRAPGSSRTSSSRWPPVPTWRRPPRRRTSSSPTRSTDRPTGHVERRRPARPVDRARPARSATARAPDT